MANIRYKRTYSSSGGRKFCKKVNSLILHLINDIYGPKHFSNEYVVVMFRLCMLQNQSNNKGWLGMHDTICDELVYTHIQAFYLTGNSKIKGSSFVRMRLYMLY